MSTADPILGLRELTEGDSLGYLRQNDRNLVVSRLGVDKRTVSNSIATPPGSVTRGQAWILSGSGSGNWAGKAAGTVAIALSDNPLVPEGWFFYVPWTGFELYLLAGSPTGWVQWNGSAWVARP